MPRRFALTPLDDRCPLRVLFVITNMPVGGAETLLCELMRRMDRERFSPELCCLKELGTLGEPLAAEVPAYSHLIGHKYDGRVLGRLRELIRRRRIDALITVGTGGDKMFWGRLAAWLEGVPVIASALHSTGLPDRVERLNRLLAPVTDAFVAVAPSHGEHLARHEGCPRAKVVVVPNGVDVERFRPRRPDRQLCQRLGLRPTAPVIGTVAALRPEKNQQMLLRVAARLRCQMPELRVLIVGDGPRRRPLERLAAELELDRRVHFLGTRADVPEMLSLLDVFVLTSHMEASPVSILEAMAAEKPVVAPRVGSVPDVVQDGRTGWLFPAGDEQAAAERIVCLLGDRDRATAMGRVGRERVLGGWSVDRMVEGYQRMITDVYEAKLARQRGRKPAGSRSAHARKEPDPQTSPL